MNNHSITLMVQVKLMICAVTYDPNARTLHHTPTLAAHINRFSEKQIQMP